MLPGQPVRIVSDGVVTRSVRDTAALLREAEKVYRPLRLPPIGDITRPGRQRLRVAVHTGGAGRSADAATAEATWRTATLLEELGHHVEEVPAPVPDSFPDDFLLYWATLAGVLVAGGRRNHGRTFDRSRLDPLTTGLARHAARSAHRIPGAIARLRRTTALAERFHERWDVALTPTLASATPPIGHLSPEPGFDQVMERLMDWVVFTPWQNATGAPAVSLPLAATPGGLPLGMMFAAAPGSIRSETLSAAGLLSASMPETQTVARYVPAVVMPTALALQRRNERGT